MRAAAEKLDVVTSSLLAGVGMYGAADAWYWLGSRPEARSGREEGTR